MTPNTTPEKPEWFQLTDGDAPSAQVKKVDKKLPAIAVLVTGAVIASGAFFANASEKNSSHQASFENQMGSNSALPPQGGAPEVDAQGAFDPTQGGTSLQPGLTAPGNSGGGVMQPGLPPQGMQPPVPGFGGDDDDDHREGRRHHDDDDEDDDDDERGEHEGRGSAPIIPNSTTKMVN